MRERAAWITLGFFRINKVIVRILAEKEQCSVLVMSAPRSDGAHMSLNLTLPGIRLKLFNNPLKA